MHLRMYFGIFQTFLQSWMWLSSIQQSIACFRRKFRVKSDQNERFDAKCLDFRIRKNISGWRKKHWYFRIRTRKLRPGFPQTSDTETESCWIILNNNNSTHYSQSKYASDILSVSPTMHTYMDCSTNTTVGK